MKRSLLTVAAFVAALTISAEGIFTNGWSAQFEPVSDAAELKGVQTAAAADGSVYVSSTYNQAFTFAGKQVADPEGLTSACILKYNEKGEEQWFVTFEGKAVIYDLDTDTDGTLYVAGNFMDEVTYPAHDNTSSTGTLTSSGVYSAFVAKIDKNGTVNAVQNITPTVNEEIASKMGDPWGAGVESPLYSMWDPIYVTPNKIEVEGDKVYVSAKYMGDVLSLGWKGSYIDMFGMMYSDNYSMGVFSLNKADLGTPASVANVQMTGIVAETQFYPEALSFTADNGTVYVGFIGFQKLTLTTADKTENYEFAVSTAADSMEHALVLATIGATTETKVYNAEMHTKLAVPYSLSMEQLDTLLLIGGTFYGQLPLDNQKTTGELASAPFVASVEKGNKVVDWTYVGTTEAEMTSLTLTDADNALFSTTANAYSYISLKDGVATQGGAFSLADADATTAVHVSGTQVCVDSQSASGSAIENVVLTPAQEEGQAYNLLGQPVGKNYKGIVIKNGKKYIVK